MANYLRAAGLSCAPSRYPSQELIIRYPQGATPQEMAGLLDKVKKTIQKIHQVGDKISSYTNPLHKLHAPIEKFVGKNAKYIAPIASMFGPIGSAIALGAESWGWNYQDAQAKKAMLKAQAGNAAALWSEYKKLAGQVPGRAIGAALIAEVMDAAARQGQFRGKLGFNPKWTSAVVRETLPKDVKPVVLEALRNGIDNPQQILQGVINTLDAWPGGHWMIPSNSVASQVLVDYIDAIIAEQNPNAKLYYGGTSTPSSSGTWRRIAGENETAQFTGQQRIRYGANGQYVERTLPGPVSCSNEIFGDPIVGTVKACELFEPPTPSTVVPVPADAVPPNVAPPAVVAPTLPPNATGADVQSALQSMIQQFMQTQQAQQMTQAQAVNAATAAAQQWLASQGVKAPPAQVAQVAQDVVQAGTGMSGTLPLLLGAGALLFALARPAPRARVYRRRSRR